MEIIVNVFPYLLGVDLSWLAGLLEGEGSFTRDKKITNKGVYYYNVQVRVAMTDKDTVDKVRRLVGKSVVNGPYRYGTNRKPYWCWLLVGDDAYNLMKLVLPLMSNRRARKIEELLSIHESERDRGRFARRKWYDRGTYSENTGPGEHDYGRRNQGQ